MQIRGLEIGIWIDSDHPRPPPGSLLPVCPAYWWWDLRRAPVPFRKPSCELSFSCDLKVPTAERYAQAEVYICATSCFETSDPTGSSGSVPCCLPVPLWSTAFLAGKS